MKNSIVVLVGLVLLSLSSCKFDILPVACTEEFVTISVNVTGATLTQTYTLLEESGSTDTVFRASGNSFGDNYMILDDSFQEELEGDLNTYVFHGYVNDSLVVNEPYQIGADACHVFKESGKSTIDL